MKQAFITAALLGALIAATGAALVVGSRPANRKHYYVQVNTLGEWRGVEVDGDEARWMGSCSLNGEVTYGHWQLAADIVTAFTRLSPLVLLHKEQGLYAEVESPSPAALAFADANMRLILQAWPRGRREGDRLNLCPEQ